MPKSHQLWMYGGEKGRAASCPSSSQVPPAPLSSPGGVLWPLVCLDGFLDIKVTG
jgi:hypothetical protein